MISVHYECVHLELLLKPVTCPHVYVLAKVTRLHEKIKDSMCEHLNM